MMRVGHDHGRRRAQRPLQLGAGAAAASSNGPAAGREAHGGMAALQRAIGQPGIDLLVTDVGLPGGMNGRRLAEAARALQPALPVLLITGYAGNA